MGITPERRDNLQKTHHMGIVNLLTGTQNSLLFADNSGPATPMPELNAAQPEVLALPPAKPDITKHGRRPMITSRHSTQV